MKISLTGIINFCLIAVIGLSLYLTCKNIYGFFHKPETGEQVFAETVVADKEVIFDNEVYFDDDSLNSNERVHLTSDGTRKEIARMLSDGSEIKTTYDAYGNKTEIRKFFNNSRLTQIMLRTSVDGSRQVYVYGQNGEVEAVPDEMLDRVMNAPADELARAAGITQTRQENTTSSFPQITRLPTVTTPNYQTQPQPTATPQTENPTITENTEVITTTDKNPASKQNIETPVLNAKP